MGIVFRQSVKSTLIVFTGAFLGILVTWLSAKYIVNKQEFGFLQILTRQALILASFLLLGLPSTVALYTHKFQLQAEKKHLLIGISILLPIVTTALFTIVYYLFPGFVISHYQGQDQVLIERYYGWLPIYAILFMFMFLFEQFLVAHMKVALYAFTKEIVIRLLNMAFLVCFAFNYISFSVLVVSTILTYLVPMVYYSFLSGRVDGFGISFKFSAFSKVEWIDIIKYSWFHYLLVISMNLMGGMDILMLPFYDHSGFEAAAPYGIALLLVSFLQMPLKAMQPATFTVLARAFTDDRIAEAKDIFNRASLNILIATLGVGLIIVCNLDNAVIILTDKYSSITSIFMILMIGRLLDISTGMNDQVLSITKYYKFNFYLSIILVFVLYLLIRFLVPVYGAQGAAWSTTITIFIFNIAKYVFIKQRLNMQPFSKNTLLVLVAALPAVAVGYYFPHLFDQQRHVYVRTFIDAGLRGGASVIVYVLMLLWLKPSKDLEEYLAAIRKNKRLF